MKAKEARALGRRISACVYAGDLDQAYALLAPVLAERTPFAKLDLIGGPYVTSGALITRDPVHGANMAIHRLMKLDGRRFTARLVEGQGTHTAWKNSGGDLPVAICIGLPLHVLLASAMSPAKGVDELHIAEALAPTPLIRCRSNDQRSLTRTKACSSLR